MGRNMSKARFVQCPAPGGGFVLLDFPVKLPKIKQTSYIH